MRIYQEIPPAKNLTKYIKRYWILEIENPRPEETINRIIPEGLFEIVINYKDPYYDVTNKSNLKLPDSFATGPLSRYRIFKTYGSIGIFAIDFTFLGWQTLTKYHGYEFTDMAADMDLLSPLLRELSRMLLHAGNNQERIFICNSYLMKMLIMNESDVHYFPILEIVKDINDCSGNIQIDKFLYKYHCSQSKFERNFKKYTGLAPKKYAKLVRFRKALELGHYYHWTDFAYDLGYYDQSHFIKEFRSFIGVSPHQYFESKNNNRLVAPDKRSIIQTQKSGELCYA